MKITIVSIIFFTLSMVLNLSAMYATWRATKIRAVRWWALSALLALVALLSLVLFFPLHWNWLLLAQNLSYYLALAFVSVGIRALRGVKLKSPSDIVVIAVALLVVSYALWIKNDFILRVAFASAAFSWLSVRIILELWAFAAGRGAMLWFGIFWWAAFALVNLSRTILVFAEVGTQSDTPYTGISYLMSFILGGVCTTGGFIGLIMLVTQRLIDEKREALQAAEKLAEEYRQLSDHDPLTNALNIRSFKRSLDLERARCIREGRSLSVVMADLDHFKEINDTFGHAAGDQTLKQAVSVWRSQLRAPDLLGRVGGEEFVIILPHANLQHAAHIAERLRSALQANARLFPREITASFGVIETGRDETTEEILGRVDVAMYAAKQNGRNRVVKA